MRRPRRSELLAAFAGAVLLIVPATAQEVGRPPAPAGVALLSAALPGAGQHRMGQGRAWAYYAVEVVGWTVYAQRRHRGGELRTRYRDLAWERGRIQAHPREDGDFAYYETLTHWVRSGAFDRDPATTGVQPEEDVGTYNGTIWDRARRLFGVSGAGAPSDPAYLQALAYYGDQAYGESFLWDWSGSPADQKAFADLIVDSDDRFREATSAVGAILANHVVSALDAFISARRAGPTASLRVEPAPWWTGSRWRVRLTLDRLP